MLITGAASGFGLELAKRFVARGDSVIATDLHDSANEDVVKLGDACTYRELDVTSDADREAAAAAIGAVDVLVLNAGIAVGGAIENVTMDTWHRALNINLLGAVCGCRAFVPLLEPGAKIVMTSSIASLIPVTVMVPPPSRGAATRPGMTYLREHFHNPGVLPPDTGDNR